MYGRLGTGEQATYRESAMSPSLFLRLRIPFGKRIQMHRTLVE